MGWLRDLMHLANPPIRSFGELAREALASPDWPAHLDIQPRSLATLFSKLDREEQLSWLTDRPAVQSVLARLCSTTPDALHRSATRLSTAAVESAALVRLYDLPAARPLDLVREPLPPGIPERLSRIDGAALWWTAPSGSGRSLCGQWLKARGRAAFITAHDWEAVGPTLPDGPVFLELSNPSRAEPTPRPGICVAAPFAPTSEGFTEIRTQDLSRALDPLCEWALSRLPSDSRLVEGPVRESLLDRMREGVIETFGDVVGWLGLLDELGAKELKRPIDRAIRRFVERRVAERSDPAAPHTGWLRRSIYALLLGLVERVFTDSELPLEAARTFDEWMALVPPEVERAVDVEWMRLSLARIETAVRPSDLERAARQLPPGAFRVITALERGGLLIAGTDDEYRLGPCWLRSALARQATAALIERSPFEWGEALLREHAAPRIASALFERTVAIGGSALEPVLDLDAEDQPAYAAAVDVAFRAAAVGRLVGADVGLEVLDGLLGEANRLAIELPTGLPSPRIDLRGRVGQVEPARGRYGAALLDPGTFFLAALSATEIASVRAPRLRALDPWHDTRPSPALTQAYDRIQQALELAPDWRDATFALVMRARAVIGNAGDPEVPHPLERPAQILDEIQHGVLDWRTLGDGEEWLEPLLALAASRYVTIPNLVKAIWGAWDEALRPDAARFLAPAAPRHEIFWRHVPETLLERLLSDARSHDVPYRVFGPEQWRAFSRALAVNPSLVADASAWKHMPAELAFSLLGSELPWHMAESSLGALWTRFPEELRASVRDRLRRPRTSDEEGLSILLRALPTPQAPALIEELGAEPMSQGISPAAVAPLRQLLHRLIGERAPGWRAAYGLLSNLERELRRVALD